MTRRKDAREVVVDLFAALVVGASALAIGAGAGVLVYWLITGAD